MVRFTAFSVVALLSTSVFAAPTKRTVAQIEADIANIASQVTTLDNAITAFPNTGGSLINALAIHTDATNLISTLGTTTTDVQNTGPVSEADGQDILTAFEAIEPVIDHALVQIAAKRPAFDGLPIGGLSALVKQDLTNLSSATATLANALISIAPSDLVEPSTELRDRLAAAFATALAAYATA